MYKELLAFGAFNPPYAPLSMELLEELRASASPIEPSPGLLANSENGNQDGLTIYYKEWAGQKFWIYDEEGFICSTGNVQVLVALIQAESRPRPNPKQPALKNGAREMLNPGSGIQSQAKLVHMQENARALAARMRERRANGPAGTPGQGDTLDAQTGDQVLRTLGLDD
jgi:hypothetical protein